VINLVEGMCPMANKPKGFGEPLHRKQQRQELQRFSKRLQGRMGEQIAGAILSPPGAAKMSEVLEAFVAPYVEYTDNRSQRVRLLEMAVVAWNLALMAKGEYQSLLEETIAQIMPDTDLLVLQDFREIVAEMVERKLKYFADYDRVIVDFELKDTGREYQLSVASLMPEGQKSQ
jgi:hypothetical protein